MNLDGVLPIAVLGAAITVLLGIDLKVLARGRQPTLREGAIWSLGWLVVSLLAALVVWIVDGEEGAVVYTTVYLIERSLSIDNLFVFLLLFAYFGVPDEHRARLVFWESFSRSRSEASRFWAAWR